ncbi:hypothetical protein MMC20_001031 [Loxospora ochrophaea]|nr:hypothetical protein [Loxospora ochrophaea]
MSAQPSPPLGLLFHHACSCMKFYHPTDSTVWNNINCPTNSDPNTPPTLVIYTSERCHDCKFSHGDLQIADFSVDPPMLDSNTSFRAPADIAVAYQNAESKAMIVLTLACCCTYVYTIKEVYLYQGGRVAKGKGNGIKGVIVKETCGKCKESKAVGGAATVAGEEVVKAESRERGERRIKREEES